MRRRPTAIAAVLVLLLSRGMELRGEGPIDFTRDIRPILSEKCFTCHGPDDAERQAGLRLDTADGALAETASGVRAIVPGRVEESELFWRITSEFPTEVMPPPETGKPLTPEEVATLKSWIEQGAGYATHWGFTPPRRADLPGLTRLDPGRNPIDTFVRARLEREGMEPSPEADRATLIRRLSLDLVGLPPALDEIDAFLADEAPDAYERLVDRLLASPHHGERWGRHWLDAARYADSDGFEKDKTRQVWFYRDWVVNALNRDLPYDRFIIEQIAGDLLPGATAEQVVATGFLRNSMINEEGGVDPEQFRMAAMFDRMDAIGKGVLGLTVQCAQCHTHKYDPLTQDDYYRMFAFLNNSHEANVAVYTPRQEAERAEIFGRIETIEADLKHRRPDWRERMASWEESIRGDQPDWRILRPELDTSGGQKHTLLDDGSIIASGYAPTKHTTEFPATTDLARVTGFRLEVLNDPNLPLGGPGRSIDGLFALTEFEVVAGPLDGSTEPKTVKFLRATADVNPPEQELAAIFHDKTDKRRVTGPIAYAIDGLSETAWGIDIGPGRSNVPRKAVFVPEEPLAFPSGAKLTIKLVQNHGGWNSDDNQNNNLGRFRFSVTDAPDPEADPLPASVRSLIERGEGPRSESEDARVFSYWRTTVPDWEAANEAIEDLWRRHPKGSSQLVLQERDTPRMTHRLERGEFTKPREAVEPGVPAFLHDLPETDGPPDRLDFARWLVDRNAPTTARSIVNRVWQAYFGIGLVETSEDLGSQAAAPSHPELLDWLAVELMDAGWSLKHLHRLIVTSATYRQSSRITPESLAVDPYNRLLGRGPRFRVEGEIVRDIALAASGLLNRRLGGPSVQPTAPSFLFEPPASYGPKPWHEATGPDRFRRALYTFRYRSVPYPALEAFDTPNGDASCVRRTRSNTPLQALVTLNEPIFLECARALARLTLSEGGICDRDRLTFAFRRCTSRVPNDREAEVLLQLLGDQRDRFASSDADPWALAAEDPAHPPKPPEGSTPADLAAWTAVARVLLNLDETITRP